MYASLHNHTEYSNLRLIDSINKVSSIFTRAKELELSGLAITDHESLSSHIEAIQLYKKLQPDFKLILGNEIYLIDSLELTKLESKPKFPHFILLAKNEEGYYQLRQLSSQAWKNHYRTRLAERVPIEKRQIEEIIGNNSGNIIASTACLAGEYANLIQNRLELVRLSEKIKDDQSHARILKELENNQIEIKNFIDWAQSIFGKDNFFIEIQPGVSKDQIAYNQGAIIMAERFGVKYIVTTDSHYLSKEQRPIHKAYLNSKDGDREVDDFYATTYFMSEQEIEEYLNVNLDKKIITTALENTNSIAAACEFYDMHKPQIVPGIDLSSEVFSFSLAMQQASRTYKSINNFLNSSDDQDRYLLYQIDQGMIKKQLEYNSTHLERIDTELYHLWEISIKISQRMSKYYVTAQKIIDIMWHEGDSLVGPARGSVTGFFICYLIDITQVNPLLWDIPWWRHLHESRPELPDIDIDSQRSKRQQILQAMKNYFGQNRVLNIATFGTEKSKSAILTACRGLGIDVDIAHYISGLVPIERGFNWSLSDCIYGNEEKERKPVTQLIKEFQKYPELQETALAIEGLVNKRSIHASGVYIFNDEIYKTNAIMRAPSGDLITQHNMDDSDYCGNLKFDFLTIGALDRIRLTLNLLLEDGLIEWREDLKSTYEDYLHPDKLDYKSKKMWEMVGNNDVIHLFQFDTQVGLNCAKKVQPSNLIELATSNSLMRLMGDSNEQPIDRYVKFKQNIDYWFEEMRLWGLNKQEQQTIKKYLEQFYGVAATQEDVMRLSMEKEITNFSMEEANKLRKTIAKKKMDEITSIHEFFNKKGIAAGTSQNVLDYIWEKQIKPQLGYSFSFNHTIPYSIIALIELNLVYRFPQIYWNTACLTVNSAAISESDFDNELILEEEKKVKATDYGKIAVAIGNIKDRGVVISPPNINKSKYGFVADIEHDQIIFGLKGINRIGDDLVDKIIENRPYVSIEDFILKIKKVNKLQMIQLIKAGTFDSIYSNKTRSEIMYEYIDMIYDKKKRLTLQNLNGLIKADMIPKEFSFQISVFNFNKYLKKFKKGLYYIFDSIAHDFYEKHFDIDLLIIKDNEILIEQKIWDKIYKKEMDKIKDWIKSDYDNLLNLFNKKHFDEEWEKYCKNDISDWEMESICFYNHEHPLNKVNIVNYGISDFIDLSYIPQPLFIKEFHGIERPIYDLKTIIGTVINKDKNKHIVTLLTPTGVVDVKFYREMFTSFDKQISEKQPDGTKKIIERSWFKRGNKLMVTGFRREDQFVPRTYKTTEYKILYLIEAVDDKGQMTLRHKRLEGNIVEEDEDDIIL